MKPVFFPIALFVALTFFSVSAHADSSVFLPFQMPAWISADDEESTLSSSARSEKILPAQKKPARTSGADLKPLMPDEYKTLIERMDPVLSNAVPLSPLEEMYSNRIVDEVRQFGYDMFGQEDDTHGTVKDSIQTGLPAGAVQDTFVLSIGDKLSVLFRGQRQTQGAYSITPDGLLIVEDLPPIPAAGRTVAQVRAALENAAIDLHNTSVFVSLENVRQANVLIIGHVNRPGRKTFTVFHTVLDALMQAGGVEKTGSLRQIKLIRNGRTQIVDLYSLLVYGSSGMDMSLRDGDKIVVPPIGPTIAVAGSVKRPGIYEILPSLRGMKHQPDQSSEHLNLQEVLDLGGGVLSPGDNRFMKLTMSPDGREITADISKPFVPQFGDGSILIVSRASEKRSEMVELAGHTRRPGLHALSKNKSLSDLISSDRILGPDIYPLIGVIERTNPKTLTRQMMAFPPNLVLSRQFDHPLQDGDTILLFSHTQIESLRQNEKNQSNIEQIAYGSSDLQDDPLRDNAALRSFLIERSAFIRGAVRNPGGWPVSEGATLEDVIDVAGGLTLEADTHNIEVTTDLPGENAETNEQNRTHRVAVNLQDQAADTVAIASGDAIRVNQKFRKTEGNSVLIAGEVAHPGRYDLLPGDTMSDLLARAGGLTGQAYPYGTIFSRESERKAEEARFRAAARELERAIAAAAEKAENAPDAQQIALARELTEELRSVEGVGRITVESDPSVLKTRPELDIMLEAGDRVYVPARPLTVRVHGEVLSPANLQFRTDKSADAYIAEAGGMTYYADDDRAFVLYPDGSAKPLTISAWNHSATMIPPGSTVVVPRDPKPFDFIESAKDISQILSNLAITGVFINDIKDDDN